jgi:hypothetical protein
MRRRGSIVCLLLPLLASGCVTHKLWTESTLDEWNEPAGDPNLHLFHDGRLNDFLVVYDEYSERHFTTQTRAFFLRLNQSSLAQRIQPHFVSTNLADHLSPIPVFRLAPTNLPAPPYGVRGTNGGSFTVFSDHQRLGPFSLPLYDDGVGRWERIAWTPLTVTADLTIVGGVVVLMVWTVLAESNSSISVR